MKNAHCIYEVASKCSLLLMIIGILSFGTRGVQPCFLLLEAASSFLLCVR